MMMVVVVVVVLLLFDGDGEEKEMVGEREREKVRVARQSWGGHHHRGCLGGEDGGRERELMSVGERGKE